MAKNYETGHAKNVANFKQLITTATGWGEDYKPFKDSLKLVNMNEQWTACNAAQKAAEDARTSYNRVVSDRSDAFEGLSKLTTRALALFDGTDAPDQVKAYAKSLADKVRGMNGHSNGSAATNGESPEAANGNGNGTESTETEEENKKHSTSQMSYVMRQTNFERFVGVLAAEPTYRPNETELTLTALELLNERLIQYNDNADVSYSTLTRARSARNMALYVIKTGMVENALAMKKYVQGAYAKPNARYREISHIKFTKVKIK